MNVNSSNATQKIRAAAGYTFRSGQMNFPINLSLLRAEDDFRIGITFGWHASQ